MPALARNPVLVAWAVLVALTALSWWLGADHGDSVEVSTSAVIVVAFAKVLVVGYAFMELRHAAARLRLAFAGWCAFFCTALVVLYLTV